MDEPEAEGGRGVHRSTSSRPGGGASTTVANASASSKAEEARTCVEGRFRPATAAEEEAEAAAPLLLFFGALATLTLLLVAALGLALNRSSILVTVKLSTGSPGRAMISWKFVWLPKRHAQPSSRHCDGSERPCERPSLVRGPL